MSRLTPCISALLIAFGACAPADKNPRKGDVDDSMPPELPPFAPGKADDAHRLVPLDIESAHPYANDMNEELVIELGDVVPGCASRVRLRFASLQLESGYDFIHIVDAFGNTVETGTGNHDGEYSEWLELGETERSVSLVLETDGSIVRHGFAIDAVEWDGAPICPAFVPSCPAGEVDTNPAPGACECPAVPTCAALGAVAASHSTGGGFAGTFTGHRLEGTAAFAFVDSVSAPDSETELGTIDDAALSAFITAAARTGVLHQAPVSQPDNFAEAFSITAGSASVAHVRPAGSYPADQQAIINHFESLFVCGPGEPLSCGAGTSCVDGECVAEADCVCPAVFEPVCAASGVTFGNACEATCAGVEVRHDGECGAAGDMCGGFGGFVCQPDHKCRFGESQFSFPFPDAAGTCVSESYCDAAADCAGLIHIAVPGSWSCDANQCAWQTGSPWLPVEGWSFASANPYGNNEAVWRQLYAPAGAASVRVELERFSLESGYDFLELWSWDGQRWVLDTRLTGDQPAGASFELGGRYHYLHFVSDRSVTRSGFAATARYSFDGL